ncbi:MAG: gamma-glutamyltransferase, partial [Bauldia litoralis]
MPRRDLLGAAIQQAKEGSAVTRSFVRCILGDRSEMTAVPGFADHYLIDGKPPEIGSLFVQERLADTLEQLSRAGFADFYRGDIAAEIAADLEAAEAPVTRDDLRKQEAVLRRPLSVPLADATLFNTPLKWVVMLAPLGMVIFLSARLHRMSLSTAQIAFWSFAALMGVSLATIFIAFTG